MKGEYLFKLILALWLVLIVCVNSSWAAGAADRCQELCKGGLLKQAFPVCRKAAEQGDAWAQCSLGAMYAEGQGVPQDYAKALYWWRKAAEQGDVHAQRNLGVMYAKGQGVPQDYAKVAKWWRKAAQQGDVHAQNNLGAMYAEGQGVPQDYAKALYWYRKAAEQGYAAAQYNLGVAYHNGQGVMQSNVAAANWFYKAGLSFLREGRRDDALRCVEMIKNLGNIPNAFLANKLLATIYK